MLIGQGGRNQTGDTQTATEGRAQRRRWAMLGGVLAAALALMALGASAAQAETPHNTVEFGCKAVTSKYEGFPSGEAVTVTEKVRVTTEEGNSTYFNKTYKFTGPTGSDTIPIQAPPGHDKIDLFAKWKTATFHGGSDQFAKGGIDWEVHMVDGTSVRAHRCAAGGNGGGSARRWAAAAAASAASCTSGAIAAASPWHLC